MKYSININQLALADSGLDIVDAAILDYLYFFCNSNSDLINQRRITEESGTWTWVNYDHLIAEMPLLGIKRKSALTPRISRLEKAGFISTKHGGGFRLYVRLLPKIDAVFTSAPAFTETNASLEDKGAFTETNASVHENESQRSPKRTNHNTRDNNTKDQLTVNKLTVGEAPEKELELVVDKSVDKRNPEVQEIVDIFTEVFKYSLPRMGFQRMAAKRLLVKHGHGPVIERLRDLYRARTEEFCPKILSPRELELKWDDFSHFLAKNHIKQTTKRKVGRIR